MLAAGSSSFGAVGREPLAAAALAAARDGLGTGRRPPRPLQRPGRDRRLPRARLQLGDDRRLAPGVRGRTSRSPAAVVERAHAAGAWVEAELGALAGDEDSSGDVEAGAMTDPDQAAEFAARTGVDALAVAVGNVHGFTPQPVRLDLDRLRAIAAATPRPARPARRVRPARRGPARRGRRRRREGQRQRGAAARAPRRARRRHRRGRRRRPRAAARARSRRWPRSPRRRSPCSPAARLSRRPDLRSRRHRPRADNPPRSS